MSSTHCFLRNIQESEYLSWSCKALNFKLAILDDTFQRKGYIFIARTGKVIMYALFGEMIPAIVILNIEATEKKEHIYISLWDDPLESEEAGC